MRSEIDDLRWGRSNEITNRCFGRVRNLYRRAIPIAVRGERVALTRVGAGGDESLALFELNDYGQLVGPALFEPTRLLDALDETDARFSGGEAAPYAVCLVPITRLQRQFSEGDIDGLHETLTADALIDDHRPASLGTISRELWFESILRLRELVSYTSVDTKYHALAADRAVVQVLFTGETDDGALAETDFHCVFLVRDGKLARIEPVRIDRLEDALAHYDELGRSAG